MSSVELVKQICKERKIPISRLERDLNFSNGYVAQLKKGVFPADRLVAISKYLDVSLDVLLGTDEQKNKPTTDNSDELYPGANDLTEENKAKVREYIELLLNAQRNG